MARGEHVCNKRVSHRYLRSKRLIFLSSSRGCWRQWRLALSLFVVSTGILTGSAVAEERAQLVKIGVLTAAWGPTPETVGLRDGLVELGYRENEDVVIGVRFTQGDLAALPAAARDLVQYGVDLIFTSDDGLAKAAQMATTQIPIVFSVVADPVGLVLLCQS